MDPEQVIKVYENLRNKAEENVVMTGVGHLDAELVEWRVIDRPENRSKDLIISISIDSKRRSLIIPFSKMLIEIKNETSSIEASRIIALKIKEELSRFIAEMIGNKVFYQAGRNIVDLR